MVEKYPIQPAVVALGHRKRNADAAIVATYIRRTTHPCHIAGVHPQPKVFALNHGRSIRGLYQGILLSVMIWMGSQSRDSVTVVAVPLNAKTDGDPEHYASFVDSLVSRTSSSLRNAVDDIATRAAIRAFLEEGYAAGLTSDELTDFFYVDTPSIIDQAEITPVRADEVVALFDHLNDRLRASLSD